MVDTMKQSENCNSAINAYIIYLLLEIVYFFKSKYVKRFCFVFKVKKDHCHLGTITSLSLLTANINNNRYNLLIHNERSILSDKNYFEHIPCLCFQMLNPIPVDVKWLLRGRHNETI